MMNGYRTTILAVSLGVLTASLACAEGSGRKAHQGDRWKQGGQGGDQGNMILDRILNNKRMTEKLDLTEDQVSALRDGIFNLKKEKIRKRAELQIVATEQARILTEGDIDESALMSAVEKTGQVRTDLAKLHMQGLLLMHKTLTKEQREKIGPMLRKRHAQRQGSGKDQHSRGSGRDGFDRKQGRDAPKRGE